MRVVGKVKWFDLSRGFGVIGREQGETDCFVRHSAMRGTVCNVLAGGDPVEFDVIQGGAGAVARRDPTRFLVRPGDPRGGVMAKEEAIEIDSIVEDVLPNRTFRVHLPNGHYLLATIARNGGGQDAALAPRAAAVSAGAPGRRGHVARRIDTTIDTTAVLGVSKSPAWGSNPKPGSQFSISGPEWS